MILILSLDTRSSTVESSSVAVEGNVINKSNNIDKSKMFYFACFDIRGTHYIIMII